MGINEYIKIRTIGYSNVFKEFISEVLQMVKVCMNEWEKVSPYEIKSKYLFKRLVEHNNSLCCEGVIADV